MNRTSHLHKSRLFLAGSLLAIPIAVLWGWNLVMPEILGVASLEFRHAFGLTVLGFVASIPFHGRRGRHRAPHVH